MKRKIALILAALCIVSSGVLFAATVTVVTQTGGTDFTNIKQTCKQYHITAKETNTVVATGARLYNVVYNVSGAGTAWTLTIQDKQGTPAILAATGSLSASTVPVSLTIPQPGVFMSGGIDIVTGGTTAGTLDLWICYR